MLIISAISCIQNRVSCGFRYSLVRSLAQCQAPAGTVEKLWSKYNQVKQSIPKLVNVDNVLPSAVFANNQLQLGSIDVYGFDYDYTLAIYTKQVNRLIFDLALQLLIDTFKYPSGLRSVPYAPEFAIRGLHYDVKNCILLKLDAFCQIQTDTVHRGRQRLSDTDVRAIYKGSYIPQHKLLPSTSNGRKPPQFRQLLDFFSLPECGLLLTVIEFFESSGIDFDPTSLFNDVEMAVRSVHVTGQLYDLIMADPTTYIHPSPQLKRFLQTLKQGGKTLFMLTNSPFPFVDRGMTYLIDQHWRDLFDYIIVSSGKPAFFNDHYRPFRKFIEGVERLSWQRVECLQPGRVYSGGNMNAFLNMAGLRTRHVIYFGDHFFSDLAEPMLQLGWRTGAIVPEVSGEIGIINELDYKQRLALLQCLTQLVERNSDEMKRYPETREILDQWLQEWKTLRFFMFFLN